MTICISKKEHEILINRAQESIRREFDEKKGAWQGQDRASLVSEAELLGCSTEFINELKRDL